MAIINLDLLKGDRGKREGRKAWTKSKKEKMRLKEEKKDGNEEE